MKNKKFVTIIVVLIGMILLGIGCTAGYGYYQLSKIKNVALNKTDDALGIRPEYEEEIKKKLNGKPVNVTNILFLGIDKQENASDSIIVLSIDEDNKKLKITSIMRDSYVDFEGQTVKKINYAYHYGGPQFAIKTVNENYDLNIKDYVKVNFEGLSSVINELGGVKIDIKDYEIPEMKNYGITKPGVYNLSGKQALGYSRIRHVGQYDYERTQRQRTVLISLFNKVRSSGMSSYTAVISKVLPYVETSMSKSDILDLGNKIGSMGISHIEELRLPLDGYKKEVMEDGLFYLKWDKEPNVEALHKFIY